MLLAEFSERTGFTPTPECYHEFIEPEYNGSTLDKDAWCKKWKKENGIAKAYDWQVSRIYNLQCNYNAVKKENERLKERLQRAENEKEMWQGQATAHSHELDTLYPKIEKLNAIKNIISQI